MKDEVVLVKSIIVRINAKKEKSYKLIWLTQVSNVNKILKLGIPNTDGQKSLMVEACTHREFQEEGWDECFHGCLTVYSTIEG